MQGFESGEDTILLSAGPTIALLGINLAGVVTNAPVAQDRILLDDESGWVLFDQDGAGRRAARHLAFIGLGLSLTADDFSVG